MISLETFFFDRLAELTIGVENQLFSIESDTLNGIFLADSQAIVAFWNAPSAAKPIDQEELITSEKSYEFKTIYQTKSTKPNLLFSFKDSILRFDEDIYVQSAFFFTSKDGQLQSLIEQGQLDIAGVSNFKTFSLVKCTKSACDKVL